MKQSLNSPAIHWEFRQRDTSKSALQDEQTIEGWTPASVPGTVHTDLLSAGQIPDPFYGQNEAQLQWIGEAGWLYRATFTVSQDEMNLHHADLVFEGLDTIADVYLNGQHVLHSENMHVPARVPVKEHLQVGENTLLIEFASALQHGLTLQAQYGEKQLWNGDPSRLYVRKAQYHYGWDWGPTFITAGVWRPARLECYAARIAEVQPHYTLSSALDQVDLTVQVSVDGPGSAQVTLESPTGEVLPVAKVGAGAYRLILNNPDLWWPNGYGSQPLYTLRARLDDGSDEWTGRLGFRRAELVQEPDLHGQSFYFRVNGVDVFCGGVNWIPDDLFIPRITPERYRARLQAAVDAHMSMIRVWGGGIYEEDVFYHLCDELGLLVWQDFMMGCGIYPAHPEFMQEIRNEAQANIRRLRHHPSLVLWCGNNEDYQLAQWLGIWGKDARPDATPADFPARVIYEDMLPAIVKELDPERPYVPSSAWSPGDVHDQQVGDRHTWEVWGNGADYRQYPSLGGRFVSEFGMCAAPAIETVQNFCPPEEQNAHSATFMAHNKTNGVDRLDNYLARNYGPAIDLPEYVYGTQLVQADALNLATSVWRSRWGHPGARACAGALVWQLQDCWPVTSWALLDSENRAKPGYYVLKRNFAPLGVGLQRENGMVSGWVVSSQRETIQAGVHVEVFSLEGELLSERLENVQATPNAVTALAWQQPDAETQVVFARLLVNGEEVSRFALWPDLRPARELPQANVQVKQESNRLMLQADKPARGVWASVPSPTFWSDNWLDLRPGETRQIQPSSPLSQQVTVSSAGKKGEGLA